MAEVMKFDDFKELGSETAVKVKISFCYCISLFMVEALYMLDTLSGLISDSDGPLGCSFLGRFSDGATENHRLPLLNQGK